MANPTKKINAIFERFFMLTPIKIAPRPSGYESSTKLVFAAGFDAHVEFSAYFMRTVAVPCVCETL